MSEQTIVNIVTAVTGMVLTIVVTICGVVTAYIKLREKIWENTAVTRQAKAASEWSAVQAARAADKIDTDVAKLQEQLDEQRKTVTDVLLNDSKKDLTK